MRPKPFLYLFFLLSSLAFAQFQEPRAVQYPPELNQELAQLRDEAMKSDWAYKQLAHLSHNIGPRLSGSAGASKAVEYVAGEMRKLGAQVTLEKVTVPHWVR